MKRTLEQIEADVVITFNNNIQNSGMVHPCWECVLNREELIVMAMKMSLELSEELGGGITTYTIHDFRIDK